MCVHIYMTLLFSNCLYTSNFTQECLTKKRPISYADLRSTHVLFELVNIIILSWTSVTKKVHYCPSCKVFIAVCVKNCGDGVLEGIK